MLILTKGLAGQTFIVTLNEAKTIASPYYIFDIANVGTSDAVTLVYSYADDISAYPERYNEFNVLAASFDNAAPGQYKYDVYETATLENQDITILNKVESGQLELKPATPINRIGYEATPGQRKGYGG